MPDLLRQIIDYIHELPFVIKMLALTLSVAIEYIFPIFPGDTIVLVAGFLNAYDAITLLEISISVLLGTLIGSSLSYGFGRLIATHKTKSRWIMGLVSHDAYRQFDAWYEKWGAWFLLFNRFFPGIRALFFLLAGMEKKSMALVLFLGGLSAVLFNSILILVGYAVGFNVERILTYFYRWNAVAITSLFIIAIGVLIYFWLRNRR